MNAGYGIAGPAGASASIQLRPHRQTCVDYLERETAADVVQSEYVRSFHMFIDQHLFLSLTASRPSVRPVPWFLSTYRIAYCYRSHMTLASVLYRIWTEAHAVTTRPQGARDSFDRQSASQQDDQPLRDHPTAFLLKVNLPVEY